MAGLTDAQLIDAKSKYQMLITGQMPRVVVDGLNGDRLEFLGVSADALLAYIRSADPNYLVTTTSISRPFRFVF